MREDTRPPLLTVLWGFISPETGDFIGVNEDGMRHRWGAAERERLRVAVEGLTTYNDFQAVNDAGDREVVLMVERAAVLRFLSDDHAEPEENR